MKTMKLRVGGVPSNSTQTFTVTGKYLRILRCIGTVRMRLNNGEWFDVYQGLGFATDFDSIEVSSSVLQWMEIAYAQQAIDGDYRAPGIEDATRAGQALMASVVINAVSGQRSCLALVASAASSTPKDLLIDRLTFRTIATGGNGAFRVGKLGAGFSIAGLGITPAPAYKIAGGTYDSAPNNCILYSGYQGAGATNIYETLSGGSGSRTWFRDKYIYENVQHKFDSPLMILNGNALGIACEDNFTQLCCDIHFREVPV